MTKNKNLAIIIFLILVAILAAAYFFWLKPIVTQPRNQVVNQVPTAINPTTPPEQQDIIAKIKNHSVRVSETSVSPQSLTVSLYDQIQFYNDTAAQEIRVVGEGWGNIPLKPGRNMTHSFTQAGTYSYQLDDLGLSGEIIVE